MNKESHSSAHIHAIGSQFYRKVDIRLQYQNVLLTRKIFFQFLAVLCMHDRICIAEDVHGSKSSHKRA